MKPPWPPLVRSARSHESDLLAVGGKRTNPERQRRWRERQAGLLGPAPNGLCEGCGAKHQGNHGTLCSRCWVRLTEEGREEVRERARRYRARKKAREGA